MCRSTPLPIMFIVTVAGTASGWALAALREARTKQRRAKKPANDQQTGRHKDSAISKKTSSGPLNDDSSNRADDH